MLIYDMRRWRRPSDFFLWLICFVTIAFVCLFSANAAAEENTLRFPSISVLQEDTGTFGLSLTNETLVTGLQIRFTYAMQGFEINNVTLTSRTTAYDAPLWQVTRSASDMVEVEVLLFSQYGAAIIPGSGDILTFHYQTSAEVAGRTPLTLTGSVLSDINIQPLTVDVVHGSVTAYNNTHDQFFGIENAPVKVSVIPVPVPEPATFVLFAGGLLLLFTIMRKGR